jgi:hypothetical protein
MFIARMIEKKKKRIEIILDVIDLSMRSDSAKETR